MKDLPYYPNIEKYNGASHCTAGVYKISSKIELMYEVVTPYAKIRHSTYTEKISCPDIRLWLFGHLHYNKIGENLYHGIKGDTCSGCGMKFPSFESLVMSVKLQDFKGPKEAI
jgi:hypothetical protein